mmetsp:Transcript_47080/g.131302  ORF Transcript_47080/g.131302 Transcript_47080/m.131302 type:complete len:241 (-) Transcript_47080:414-1136(-)
MHAQRRPQRRLLEPVRVNLVLSAALHVDGEEVLSPVAHDKRARAGAVAHEGPDSAGADNVGNGGDLRRPRRSLRTARGEGAMPRPHGWPKRSVVRVDGGSWSGRAVVVAGTSERGPKRFHDGTAIGEEYCRESAGGSAEVKCVPGFAMREERRQQLWPLRRGTMSRERCGREEIGFAEHLGSHPDLGRRHRPHLRGHLRGQLRRGLWALAGLPRLRPAQHRARPKRAPCVPLGLLAFAAK